MCTKTRLWIAAVLLFAGACAEPSLGPAPNESSLATVTSLTTSSEVPVIDRFQLSLRAQGRFKPGAPIEIVTEARANLPTDAVQIRILVPEIELSRLTGWDDDFSFLPNRALPAALSTEPRRLQAKETLSRSVNVTALRPGYYRVVATIRSTEPQPLTYEGQWIRNEAVVEAWLLVTETGGMLTQKLDAQRIPGSFDKQPGPFRHGGSKALKAPPDRFEGQASSHGPNVGVATLAAPVPGGITFRAVYHNAETNAYDPVPNADTKVFTCTVPEFQFACDPETGWQLALWTYTGPDGSVVFDCQAADQYRVEIQTHAGGVNYSVAGASNGRSGVIADDCGSTFDLALDANAARVFVNLGKTKTGTTALFGMSRPFISAVVTSSDGSHYTPSQDVIYINTGDIWFDWGIFTVAHEYGHAFHEASLGGNTGGGTCSLHFLDTESDLQCAFSEGFADYFGVSVRSDLAFFSYRDAIEADFYFPGCRARSSFLPDHPCIGGTSYEGSLIEGAYAAFLYDLTDTVSEPHDSIAAPGSYVADLIRTCQVKANGAWWRADGTDYMAYCAENAINPTGYFTRRGLYPIDFAESAVESGGWTSARVHRNWTFNMYEKR